ncbi:MAG TPA: nuclear transport factor 2 family protein [Lacunisphaera sp.]|jgi:ketosteroid isomerase-like protein|nr:nuclear transport factor 2 family protein [Lacunisphaera sp.]
MHRAEFLSQPARWAGCCGLALACALGPQPAAAAPASPEADAIAAVLAVNDRMLAAANRLDTEAFFADIVASDETRIVQDGRLFATRLDAMTAVRESSQNIGHLDRHFVDPHVTLLAPEVALLTAGGTTTVTLLDGRRFESSFAVTLVFVVHEGRWKLFHGHYSVPNPRPT